MKQSKRKIAVIVITIIMLFTFSITTFAGVLKGNEIEYYKIDASIIAFGMEQGIISPSEIEIPYTIYKGKEYNTIAPLADNFPSILLLRNNNKTLEVEWYIWNSELQQEELNPDIEYFYLEAEYWENIAGDLGYSTNDYPIVKQQGIIDIFNLFGNFYSDVIVNLTKIFYDNGLTAMGVLAVAGLAIGVTWLVYNIIKDHLKFRG